MKWHINALLLAFLASVAFAVFSDDTENIDWHKSHIGQLSQSPSKSLYYSQDTNILAALDSKTGNILWRKFFENIAPSSSFNPTFYSTEKFTFVGFSQKDESCKILKLNAQTGSLSFEYTFNGKCLSFFPAPSNQNILIVLTSAGYFVFDMHTVSIISQFLPDPAKNPYELISMSHKYVIFKDTKTGALIHHAIDLENFSKNPFLSSPQIEGPGLLLAFDNLFSNKSTFIWKEDNTNSIFMNKDTLLISGDKIKQTDSIHAEVLSHDSIVVLVDDTLYGFTEGKLTLTLPNTQFFSVQKPKYDMLSIVTFDNTIKVLSVDKWATVLSRDASFSTIARVSGEFIQYANGVVEEVSGAWSRDESLANIVDAVIVDYPDLSHASLDIKEALYEEHASVADAFRNRVVRHYHDAKYFLSNIQNYLNLKTISSLIKTSGGHSIEEQVYFGFRKIFIAVSSTGRVQALDSSNNGTQIWALDLNFKKSPLFVSKLENHVSIIDSTGLISTIDGLTGNITKEVQINLEKDERVAEKHDLFLDSIDEKDFNNEKDEKFEEKIKIPVVWTTKNRLFTLDGSLYIPEERIYITKVASDKKNITGYYFEENTGNLVKTWTFRPEVNHVIDSIASRSKLDRTVNVAHVLADRSVLYKYLHPNMIAVATTGSGTLHVYLIDSVTGKVLHTKKHITADYHESHDNIHLVFGEHSIIYTFWANIPTIGQNVVVWDLYESDIPNEHTLPSEYSSFDDYSLPHVKSQSFFMPKSYEHVTSIGITRTKYGVSVRDIIFATTGNQILGIPKRPDLLDARRPVDRQPTNTEKAEEGLAKYDSLLPYDPKSQVLSHRLNVAGIKQIVTVPAILESTSIVACYGLDIFFTRVSPSKQFDVLSSSFGKDKLLYTILAMLGLLMYVKPLVTMKQTNAVWRDL